MSGQLLLAWEPVGSGKSVGGAGTWDWLWSEAGTLWSHPKGRGKDTPGRGNIMNTGKRHTNFACPGNGSSLIRKEVANVCLSLYQPSPHGTSGEGFWPGQSEVCLLEAVLPTATAKGLLMILRENLFAMSALRSLPVSVGMVGKCALVVLGGSLEPICGRCMCYTPPKHHPKI